HSRKKILGDMILLNEKQEAFFKALKQIKDVNVEISSGYLHPKSKFESTIHKKEYQDLQRKLTTNEDVDSFKKIQNEIIENVLYQVMELVDGYVNLGFKIDLIDRQSGESLRKNIELHDKVIEFFNLDTKK
ncbi:MAG TPA: hypothetical protein VF941_10020, partial [Clostridia bacterium]